MCMSMCDDVGEGIHRACRDPRTELEWEEVPQRAGGDAYRKADLESEDLAPSPTSAPLLLYLWKEDEIWHFCGKLVVGIKWINIMSNALNGLAGATWSISVRLISYTLLWENGNLYGLVVKNSKIQTAYVVILILVLFLHFFLNYVPWHRCGGQRAVLVISWTGNWDGISEKGESRLHPSIHLSWLWTQVNSPPTLLPLCLPCHDVLATLPPTASQNTPVLSYVAPVRHSVTKPGKVVNSPLCQNHRSCPSGCSAPTLRTQVQSIILIHLLRDHFH